MNDGSRTFRFEESLTACITGKYRELANVIWNSREEIEKVKLNFDNFIPSKSGNFVNYFRSFKAPSFMLVTMHKMKKFVFCCIMSKKFLLKRENTSRVLTITMKAFFFRELFYFLVMERMCEKTIFSAETLRGLLGVFKSFGINRRNIFS